MCNLVNYSIPTWLHHLNSLCKLITVSKKHIVMKHTGFCGVSTMEFTFIIDEFPLVDATVSSVHHQSTAVQRLTLQRAGKFRTEFPVQPFINFH